MSLTFEPTLGEACPLVDNPEKPASCNKNEMDEYHGSLTTQTYF